MYKDWKDLYENISNFCVDLEEYKGSYIVSMKHKRRKRIEVLFLRYSKNDFSIELYSNNKCILKPPPSYEKFPDKEYFDKCGEYFESLWLEYREHRRLRKALNDSETQLVLKLFKTTDDLGGLYGHEQRIFTATDNTVKRIREAAEKKVTEYFNQK